MTRTGAGEVFDTEREEKKDSLAFFLPIKTCAPPTERWEKEDKSVPWLFAGLQVVAVADVLFRGGGGGGGEGVSFQELGYAMLIMIVSKI